ncbi:hypothetical protein [Aureimonas mangrovi]|uniref:hypothetical protein n=1 Tax=Aureimonas mangrovi TaxID=2758041 RepID=UPI003CCD4B12
MPAERMKAGRGHVVPLPARVVEILQPLYDGREGDLVFRGTKGHYLSDMSLGAVLKRMKVPATVPQRIAVEGRPCRLRSA